jgi:hypothetical protein
MDESDSKPERLAAALHAVITTTLADETLLTVERNSAAPEEITARRALVIVRDGEPGQPDTVLGGFAADYYSHEFEIELYVADLSATARDSRFDRLKRAILAAITDAPTLGGLAFGVRVSEPTTDTSAGPGGIPIKSGLIQPTYEYDV